MAISVYYATLRSLHNKKPAEWFASATFANALAASTESRIGVLLAAEEVTIVRDEAVTVGYTVEAVSVISWEQFSDLVKTLPPCPEVIENLLRGLFVVCDVIVPDTYFTISDVDIVPGLYF